MVVCPIICALNGPKTRALTKAKISWRESLCKHTPTCKCAGRAISSSWTIPVFSCSTMNTFVKSPNRFRIFSSVSRKQVFSEGNATFLEDSLFLEHTVCLHSDLRYPLCLPVFLLSWIIAWTLPANLQVGGLDKAPEQSSLQLRSSIRLKLARSYQGTGPAAPTRILTKWKWLRVPDKPTITLATRSSVSFRIAPPTSRAWEKMSIITEDA